MPIVLYSHHFYMIIAGILPKVDGNSAKRRTPRLIGSTSEVTGTTHRYPWMCSIRTRGYNGRHRCGATLLSGPPKKTVLVSAAHCHYICKNNYGETLEMCCCRAPSEPGSCRDVSYFPKYVFVVVKIYFSNVSDQFLLP